MADGGAFAALAAPMVQQAGAGEHDPSKLVAWVAHEMQSFFQHMQSSVELYGDSGELPPSLFK